MSGRKGTVIWICTVVILVVLTLSGGIGIGVSAAADSAEFRVVEATLEERDDVIDTRDVEIGPHEMRIVESLEPSAAGTRDPSVTNVYIGTIIGTVTGSPGRGPDPPGPGPDAPGTEPDSNGTEADAPGRGPPSDVPGRGPDTDGSDSDEPEPDSDETDSDETETEPDAPDQEPDSDETDSDETDADDPEPDAPDQEPDSDEPDSDGTNAASQEPNSGETDSEVTSFDEIDSDETDSEETDPDSSTEADSDEPEPDSDETDSDETDTPGQDPDSDETDSDEPGPNSEESEPDADEPEPDAPGQEPNSDGPDTDESDAPSPEPDTPEPNPDSDEPDGDEPDTDEPEPDSNGNTNPGGGGGPSGPSGSTDSPGSITANDEEPTVVRTESDESVTVDVDGATGERYDIAVNLAGPSNPKPAVSVSSVSVDPAGDRAAFKMTIGRPTVEPSGRDPVPHGVALGYIEFDSTLGADGTSAATLQFDIDEEAIPRGLGPENVAVLRYVDGEWTTENVRHDVEGDTHTVTLPHATPVAVVALEPGRVEVVESVVPADQVRVGFETTLRATVENPGDHPATRNLTVSMNGETVGEREVTLDPGENATVQIGFRPRESGTVSLEGNEVGEITLFGDGDDATSTDAETNEAIPGFGAIAAVLALLVTACGARVRRP